VQVTHLFFGLILFLPIYLCVHAKEILWSENTESQLLQSMFLQSYKGKWYPMSNKTMPFDEFSLKGGRLYKEQDPLPFTGWYAQYDEMDEPRMLCSFVDGQKNGFAYLWDDNGTRRFQGEYLNNQKNGQFLEWDVKGVQISEKNYRYNKLNGNYHLWYETGKIKLDAFFKEGKLLEARGWYPDGRPCPYSRVANGRGVILRYANNYKPDEQATPTKSIIAENFGALSDILYRNQPEDLNQTATPVYESDQFDPGLPKSD